MTPMIFLAGSAVLVIGAAVLLRCASKRPLSLDVSPLLLAMLRPQQRVDDA